MEDVDTPVVMSKNAAANRCTCTLLRMAKAGNPIFT